MRQALFKCETPRLKLKSSRTFLAIKRCEGTKIGKVIKHLQSSKLRWAHICAHTRIPVNVLSPWWRIILLTTTWHVWFTDEHFVTLLLACREYYIMWLSSCLTIAWHDWHTITVLSPCWRSILLTKNQHVWYTDEHVVTLLAEHTILCLVDVHT